MAVPVITPENVKTIKHPDGRIDTVVTVCPLKLANAVGKEKAKKIIQSTTPSN